MPQTVASNFFSSPFQGEKDLHSFTFHVYRTDVGHKIQKIILFFVGKRQKVNVSEHSISVSIYLLQKILSLHKKVKIVRRATFTSEDQRSLFEEAL